MKGETKLFNNCEEYFDWLAESKEAVYMWRGCVDVLAISNMAHMEIDIVVHEDGLKPELQTYKPDPEFPWLEEDKMKPKYKNELQQGKMSVLNWKNVHFNLIVSQTHMLAQLGSLSFQAAKQASVQPPSEAVEASDIEGLDSEIVLVRKKGFVRSNPQSAAIPNFVCEKCSYEAKTEVTLKEHMQNHEQHAPNFNCTYCNNKFVRQVDLERHQKKSHRTGSNLNCDDCDFQAHTASELKKHLDTAHHRPARVINTSLLDDKKECNVCKNEFSDWWNLMNHRRDVHPERRRRCRNDINDNCSYEASECWWKHKTDNLKVITYEKK